MPKHNITLAADETGVLDEAFLLNVKQALWEHGKKTVESIWIDEGRAARLSGTALEVSVIYATLRKEIGARPIDIIVRPQNAPRFKLLLADMESTIIEQEMLDELADKLGLRDEVTGITQRGMNGEIDFAESLRTRTRLLKDKPVQWLDEAAASMTPMKGAQNMITSLKEQGAQCWLVSGGFSCFANRVAQQLGFDRVFSNELEVENGLMSGNVLEPVRDGNSKKETLDFACRELGIGKDACLVVGDGFNDIPMLVDCNQGGGLGVAFHAKPVVREVIPHQINHTGLKTLALACRKKNAFSRLAVSA